MSEAKLPLHELDRSTVRSILSFASAMVGFAAVMGANAMMKRPLWRQPWNFVIIPTTIYYSTEWIQKKGEWAKKEVDLLIDARKEKLFAEGKLDPNDPAFQRSVYSK